MVEYLFEADLLTADGIEASAGLSAKSIELIIYPTGAIKVISRTPLTTTQQNAIKDELTKHGLPKGKKPKDAR